MDKSPAFTFSLVVLLTVGGVASSGVGLAASPAPVTDSGVTPSETVTLSDRENETQVVVRLRSAELSSGLSSEQVVRTLKRHANRTQRPVETFAATHEGVTVVRRFWLTNAVVLEVKSDRANLTALGQVEDVTELHTNFEVEVGRAVDRRSSAASNGSDRATDALDRIDAPEAWDEFDARGEGVKVAVLDNGIDVSHPDLDLYTTDPGDPTYPGGWAEFDENGQRVENSTPHIEGVHGTHTSGIVAGGNASGTYVGVAPEAELMHGLVVTRSSGSFARVLAGIQWAVEQDADVLSISLGATGYYPEFVEPIRRAEAAGTIVVGSVGNAGAGTSNPPANVYESVAVGAVTENGSVAAFSGGERIETRSAWGSAAPADWPNRYAVPDIVAPGVGVRSTVAGGEYAESKGTSTATPFVAGTVALMLSATDHELTTDEIRLGLTATATPASKNRSGNRTRYGSGVVDAADATAFAADPGRVTGRVTTPTGEPVADATITLAGGRVRTTTDASGAFSVSVPSGTWNVTASGFEFESGATRVAVRPGGNVSADLRLEPLLAVGESSADSGVLEAGRAFDAELRLANAESVAVEFGPNSSVAPANVTLFVGDRVVQPGESVPVSSGPVSIDAVTAPGTDGSLELEYTVRGDGARRRSRLGSVPVVPRVVSVGVVDVGGSKYGPRIASALEESLPARYRVRNVTAESAPKVTDRYDVFVVQRFGNDSGRVARFVEATDARNTGVVFLGSHENDFTTAPSDAIRRLAATGDGRFEVESAADGEGPVSFEILRNHSIFEGVGSAGDEVEVYDSGAFGDRSWFEGYSGTPLATVRADGTEYEGTSVAVDDDRRHALLTLGREKFVAETFTSAADDLLANAVRYVTPLPKSRAGPVPVSGSGLRSSRSFR